jgi:hypothetical protein
LLKFTMCASLRRDVWCSAYMRTVHHTGGRQLNANSN